MKSRKQAAGLIFLLLFTIQSAISALKASEIKKVQRTEARIEKMLEAEKKENCFQWLKRNSCLFCHRKKTPQVVKEWKASKPGKNDVSCITCHGSNPLKRREVTPERCERCHGVIVEKFKYGNHGFTMLAAKKMFKQVPSKEKMEGDCGACHRIYAQGKCQSCHKPHKFEIPETKNEASCLRCHKEPIGDKECR